jgi:hypothetical protein
MLATQMPAHAQDKRTRADVLTELAQAEASYKSQSTDATRLTLARLLYQSGEFWRADTLARPFRESKAPSDSALELAARLSFLVGRYEEANTLYDRLAAMRAGNVQRQVMARVGQMFALNQLNSFDRVKALPFPPGVVLPQVKLMASFDSAPYRIEWKDEKRTAEVEWFTRDPLPQFPIEVNGVPLNVLYDTGGDILILDEEVAKALGVVSVASASGKFGGGMVGQFGFGKVDRVTVGSVTIHDVPVMIMPAKRFTFDKRHPLAGIFGTALTRQFLTTLDYKNQKLILRERTADNARAIRRELGGDLAAEIPFVLDASHLMMARGGLNGKTGLTWFMDSGLAMQAAFTAPIQTLNYTGIPVPETRMPEGTVGGGGGKWASGIFDITSLSVGPLQQTSLKGEYGARPPESYWANGFIVDGLVSHNFLRQYSSWTLDFNSMTYLFAR